MKTLIKSIFAGLLISIGSIIYVKIGGWAGATAFSIGLLVILCYEYKLYTGYVAYVNDKCYLKNVSIILLGNIIGCCVLLALPKFEAAEALWAAKVSRTFIEKIIYSIFCGMLIFYGTNQFKERGPLLTIFSVIAFILCGAEHSIANTCYALMARAFTLETAATIGIHILGNAVGAIIAFGAKNLTK